jgi:hypothetical protein
MTLAFNVLVPRGGWWPVLLVAGNLGIFGSADMFATSAPVRLVECFDVQGPRALRFNPETGFGVEAVYGPLNWSPPERQRTPGKRTWDSWRWSMGDATVVIRNPHGFAVLADLSFGLATVDDRTVAVTQDGRKLWSGALRPAHDNRAFITAVRLPPGDTELTFRSDRPPVSPGNGDPRRFAFSVRDLTIDLKGEAPR